VAIGELPQQDPQRGAGVHPTEQALHPTGADQGGLVLFIVGVTSVVLFNRPKFMVAPHVRHQPGLVAIWRRSMRIQRVQRVSRELNRTDDSMRTACKCSARLSGQGMVRIDIETVGGSRCR
jgi:hypothetical protein